ncbi:MAG: hypothetical protein OXL37_02790 [Chloroflexota bacterium]|nr:hypothetical protein [Chloroflexota bacterium]MDE2961912.1 hypothetical protein [Chloroflexota bacterium]
MKTLTVTDELYSALEEVANRSGQTVSDLVCEAIQVWLDDIAADEADREKIEAARSESAKGGSVEFETFFADLLDSQD